MFAFSKRKSRGMTLVEVILVMAILSVVMLAVMSLYIPAHQSTVAQTQVSDIQSGHRLALKVMTRDIMHAGFLAPANPIKDQSSSAFTIETRIVGSDFARVSTAVPHPSDPNVIRLNVASSDMAANFPAGSILRVFEPINADEVQENPAASLTDDKRAYPVVSDGGTPTTAIDIDTSQNPNLDANEILAESVAVRIRSQNAPPMQTIIYRLNNGSLERVINGDMQVLARDVDLSNTTPPGGTSFFDYDLTDSGRVNSVDIKLTGKTKALKNDAISGEKVRSVSTSVKLRNVF